MPTAGEQRMMRAVRIEEFGPLESLDVRRVPVSPPSGRDEVLVAVRGAAVNPIDVKNAVGLVKPTSLPRIPGRDFAGVVVDGPPELIGKEIWGTGGGLGVSRDGSHAEFVLVPATGVREKPAALSFVQAASVGVSYSAAWLALAKAARVSQGEVVLVVGASGAVGRAATEIAHWRGAKVIGADRILVDGATYDHAVDTSKQELEEAVKRLTSGKGVDVVVDTVGGAMFEPTLKSVGHRARYVVISSVGERRVSLDLVDFYHQELSLFGVDTMKLDLKSNADILDELRPGFESSALRPPRTKEFPLESVSEAYRKVQDGSFGDKVILVP